MQIAADVGARLGEFEAELRARFPRYAVLEKAGRKSQRVVGTLLAIVTLGAARGYVRHFHTTWGQRLYVCGAWHDLSPAARYILLRHEAVHMAQFKRYGHLGMMLRYAGWPLPLGLAYSRARLEWEAYAQTIAATYEVYGAAALTPAFRAHIIAQFCGGDYGWMWPFRRRVGAWYDQVAAELAAN
ncbi:MAG: hypothetical protein IPL79_14215 [Myxococcales bacterium]|nr:hypothetical protein [Myxococcales bacterium]